ncbi:hypothetical protein KIPB_003025, partial [Kipferlia bialata]|eukprot:g3025.t1
MVSSSLSLLISLLVQGNRTTSPGFAYEFLSSIKDALSNADALYLARDTGTEGEGETAGEAETEGEGKREREETEEEKAMAHVRKVASLMSAVERRNRCLAYLQLGVIAANAYDGRHPFAAELLSLSTHYVHMGALFRVDMGGSASKSAPKGKGKAAAPVATGGTAQVDTSLVPRQMAALLLVGEGYIAKFNSLCSGLVSTGVPRNSATYTMGQQTSREMVSALTTACTLLNKCMDTMETYRSMLTSTQLDPVYTLNALRLAVSGAKILITALDSLRCGPGEISACVPASLAACVHRFLPFLIGPESYSAMHLKGETAGGKRARAGIEIKGLCAAVALLEVQALATEESITCNPLVFKTKREREGEREKEREAEGTGETAPETDAAEAEAEAVPEPTPGQIAREEAEAEREREREREIDRERESLRHVSVSVKGGSRVLDTGTESRRRRCTYRYALSDREREREAERGVDTGADGDDTDTKGAEDSAALEALKSSLTLVLTCTDAVCTEYRVRLIDISPEADTKGITLYPRMASAVASIVRIGFYLQSLAGNTVASLPDLTPSHA